jgi:hypothetical protein
MFSGPLHNAGPDGLCEECGERFPCTAADAIYDQVVRRNLTPNPRCPDCKTGPMFHPAHRWEPCLVRLPGGEVCGCISTNVR